VVDRPGPKPADRRRQVRIGAAIVLVALLLIFGFENSERVKIDFILFDRESRLIYIIIGSAIVGAIVAALVRRGRGRARGRERERG
jgi:uncharacterized integral membrane protein